jgi:HD-GYP domain-containing protein (c-di-GMP phosphodiesterase class II)
MVKESGPNPGRVPVDISVLREKRDVLYSNRIPVWRKNRLGEWVTVPLDRLDQFAQMTDRKVIFYVDREWELRISPTDSLQQGQNDDTKPDPFASRIEEIRNLSFDERQEYFSSGLFKLTENLEAQKRIDEENVDDLVDITSSAIIINKTFFEDNLDEDVSLPHAHLKSIAIKTTQFADIVIRMLRENEIVSNYLNMLQNISTGSTLDHMNNVFLRFIPYTLYYNSYFNEGRIARLRINYDKRYRDFYESVSRTEFSLDFETIFLGGMRSLDETSLQQLALGSLLHDIGKVKDIDYFEGESDYDRQIIVKHAPMSYNMIVKSREFNREVALMAALHHEYYGHPSGYGLKRLLFPDNNYRFRHPESVLSYDPASLATGQALAYVPAKMLEIVDVFDALIDSSRRYRDRANTPEEALSIMQSTFIQENRKLDPILFDIFVDFVRDNADIKNTELIDSIQQR